MILKLTALIIALLAWWSVAGVLIFLLTKGKIMAERGLFPLIMCGPVVWLALTWVTFLYRVAPRHYRDKSGRIWKRDHRGMHLLMRGGWDDTFLHSSFETLVEDFRLSEFELCPASEMLIHHTLNQRRDGKHGIYYGEDGKAVAV
jgi:hypothetical protein